MEPEKRKAGRPPRRKPEEKLGNSIKIEDEAARVLEIQAKKLKATKGKFASAAIAYCVAAGINPLDEQVTSLASVALKVEAGVANVRTHNADIGNRLFALTRSFEKTIYLFMQQQESVMTKYLEGIEGTIMRRLVSMEDNLLRPLIERTMQGYLEAHLGRGIGERIYLKALGQPDAAWSAQNKAVTDERDEELVKLLREFMTSHPIPAAKSTLRPAATPVPAPAPLPPKSVAPAAAPNPAVPPAPTTTPPKS